MHTIEYIEKLSKEKFGDNFEFLSAYRGVDSKITIKHKICGTIFEQTPYNFFKGHGCKKCTSKRLADEKRMSQEEFTKRLYQRFGEQYTVIGQYISYHSPIKVRHNFYYDKDGNKISCGKISVFKDSGRLLTKNARRSNCEYCLNKKHIVINKKNIKVNDLYKFCVYKHENIINGKIYIGITSTLFNKRWNNGKKYSDNPYFISSIEKYGWNNFKHYIYLQEKWQEVKEYENMVNEYNLSFNEACNLEKKFIEYYRFKIGKDNVYNINDGGEGGGNYNNKIILQYTLDGKFLKEYINTLTAAKITKINAINIRNCCNGYTTWAGRYQWKYKGDNKKIYPIKISNRGVKVLQYDLTGKYLKTFDSIASACKITGISSNSIFDCCKSKNKTAGGFQWKYINSNKIIEKIDPNELNIYKKIPGKSVLKYDLNGNLLKRYNSVYKASQDAKTPVIPSCQNKCITIKGFIWIYDNKDKEKNLNWHLNKAKNKDRIGWQGFGKRTYQYDLTGKLIAIYNTCLEASKNTNVTFKAISNCCLGKSITCCKSIFLYERKDYMLELKRRILLIQK